MARRRKPRTKKKPIFNERFANKVITIIGITTLIFIIMQYMSFLKTGVEQTMLIDKYFTAVVIECGALMLKRTTEVVVSRVKKKEQLDINNESEV